MKFRNILLVKNLFARLIKAHSFAQVSFLLVVFMVLAFSPLQSKAQPTGVKVGDRVRLDVPSIQKRPMIGNLSEINAHGLVLHGTDSTYFIPHSSVHELSVSTGNRRNIGKGAMIGLLGGAALGGIIGIISYEECTEEGFMACFMAPENQGQAFALGAVLGALPGSLVGVAIGSAKTDRWEKVPTRLLLNLEPVGSMQPIIKPQVTLRWSIGSRR